MKITSDKEYFKALERLLKGAEYLENPLLNKEDYEKGMKLYDAIDAEIECYQLDCRSRGHCIEDHRTGEATDDREQPEDAA